jgi:hypothetical protein
MLSPAATVNTRTRMTQIKRIQRIYINYNVTSEILATNKVFYSRYKKSAEIHFISVIRVHFFP